jgi:hypothetical protein
MRRRAEAMWPVHVYVQNIPFCLSFSITLIFIHTTDET